MVLPFLLCAVSFGVRIVLPNRPIVALALQPGASTKAAPSL
jgi:hypothetical protein